MKQFLKSSAVQLVNGGYLSNGEGAPVFNAEFVNAQKHAEYIVKFAELAKGKIFKDVKGASLAELENQVRKALQADAPTFVALPKEPKKTITSQLAGEAMEFIKFQSSNSKAEKTNEFLQQFLVISEFEEFGLFFEEDIVKLNKIFTMKEIITAVEQVIDLLK